MSKINDPVCPICHEIPILCEPDIANGRWKYHLSCSGKVTTKRIKKQNVKVYSPHHRWLHVSGDSIEEVMEKWEVLYG